MNIKNILIYSLFFLFLFNSVNAEPGDWVGEVSISNVAVSAGTQVHVYTGNNLLSSTNTPTTVKGGSLYGDDFYILVFEAAANDPLSFKVCGIEALATNFTVGTHPINLSLSKQPDLTLGCTCDAVCTGGQCVNPGLTTGICSSNTYYCDNDGSCEQAYGENTGTCPADCTSGTGGGSGGGGGGSFGSNSDSSGFGRVASNETETEDETTTTETSTATSSVTGQGTQGTETLANTPSGTTTPLVTTPVVGSAVQVFTDFAQSPLGIGIILASLLLLTLLYFGWKKV